MAPLTNDPIKLGRLIQFFRHLKHLKISTDDNLIFSSGIILLVPFLATREVMVLLANDPIMWDRSKLSLRHFKNINLYFISDSIDKN